jgi:hypothetical protein
MKFGPETLQVGPLVIGPGILSYAGEETSDDLDPANLVADVDGSDVTLTWDV